MQRILLDVDIKLKLDAPGDLGDFRAENVHQC